MKNRVIRKFSLIELLIVIGILGALLTLVLPGFNNTSDDAKDTVAKSEMREIQKQFQRFYQDLMRDLRKSEEDSEGVTTNRYLQDIALYGIWPLMFQNHPVLTETDDWTDTTFKKYTSYDADTQFGWNGPYLEYEGIKAIEEPVITYSIGSEEDNGDGSTSITITAYGGQSEGSTTSTIKIPVIKDPYGGYYRVLCPESRTDGNGNSLSEYERLKRLVLVCTGPDRTLDTTTSSFTDVDSDDYVKIINGDDLEAQDDDIVVRLLPMVQ